MENSKTSKKSESVETKKTTANADKAVDNNQSVDANSDQKDKLSMFQVGLISPNKLINVGAHIGMHPSRWNPKMKPYIYTRKETNDIIDIVKTLIFLKRACDFLTELTKQGGNILIVGTRGKLLKEHIEQEAIRSNSFYVVQRWLGGTLTNYKNIKKSIKKMNDNLQIIQDGTINNYTKKERLLIQKETDKLLKFYGGIKNMRRLPNAILIIDPVNDLNAVKEARKLNIPVIAFANTNADPNLIDYIIPVNNNSITSVILVLNILIDSICKVLNKPMKVIGVPEEEIVLVEKAPRVKKPTVNHKKFSRNH